MAIDLEKIRRDFPILSIPINGKRLVYLDSAATTLKPQVVVDRITQHYLYESANVHRGIHFLSDQITTYFEQAREEVERFLSADSGEVVFTHGTTESINIVAHGFGQEILQKNDEILLTELEHHSNIVPWQLAAQRSGAKVKFAKVTDKGELDLDSVVDLLNERTKVASISAVSNTLGTKTPVTEFIRLCHSKNVPVMVDAAQAVANMPVNVKEWNCDFLAFSGHKIFGPTGIGVLYGKKEWLERLPPLLGGGSMIKTVTFEGTTFLDAPMRFEAGTPHIAGVIGMAEALRYVQELGFANIQEHEQELLNYANEALRNIPKVKIMGTSSKKVPIISMVLEGMHHQDIGSILDQEGVAVRTGHHCTQPLLAKWGLKGTVRAAFSIYNTQDDIDQLALGLQKAIELLG